VYLSLLTKHDNAAGSLVNQSFVQKHIVDHKALKIPIVKDMVPCIFSYLFCLMLITECAYYAN